MRLDRLPDQEQTAAFIGERLKAEVCVEGTGRVVLGINEENRPRNLDAQGEGHRIHQQVCPQTLTSSVLVDCQAAEPYCWNGGVPWQLAREWFRQP